MARTKRQETHPTPPPEVTDLDQEPKESEVLEAGADLDAELASTPKPQAPQSDDKALAPVTALQQYMAEVRRYPFLTKEEELRLFEEYRSQGNRDAAVKLILANLRVAIAIASEYAHAGFDQMDLIQEGNVGLLQAIKKFDPARNVRFYAYAAWWARAYILRYLLNNFRLVKVGTTQDQRKLFYNLRKEKAKLEREGFAPDTKLLADRLNVRERDVIEMDQRLGSWELSLDQPLTQETESTLLDVLPSQDQAVDEQIAKQELQIIFREKLALFIKTLPERDEDIFRNRLLSDTPITLEDLGHKYGITKERTRQLEARLIKRFRDYLRKEIQDFDRLRV